MQFFTHFGIPVSRRHHPHTRYVFAGAGADSCHSCSDPSLPVSAAVASATGTSKVSSLPGSFTSASVCRPHLKVPALVQYSPRLGRWIDRTISSGSIFMEAVVEW